MRVLLINSVCGIRSTGRIVTDIAEQYMQQGHIVKIAYGRERVPENYKNISYRIGNEFSVKVHALIARLLDNEGFNAKSETAKFLKWADKYNPELLWLHNLHGYYLNIEMLFEWIKNRPHMEVRWTLHDCWAFTGHCSHFSFVQCDQWKKGCVSCCQKKWYPTSWFLDMSKKSYNRKKVAFTNVNKMTVITPSKWLADLVKQSFLREYLIQVEHNVIDKNIFKPTPSDFKKKYDLEDKKIVLGVATAWSDRKGLSDFVKLSKMLTATYQIILVGMTAKQMKVMPKEILCLPRTNSTKELAEIYTAADVFVNLSFEETFGLTTIEALACGTPAIVYEGTACEEIANIYGGIVVNQTLTDVLKAINEI